MEQHNLFAADAKPNAYISDCGSYRYTLNRSWGEGEGRCVFIMLNPSTADSMNDDPTIRRCMGYAHSWGFQALRVLNLFAFRSTNPMRLRDVADPIGPENDNQISLGCRDAQLIVAAWGNHGGFLNRGNEVIAMLEGFGTWDAETHQTHCLGMSKLHQPKHPLYLRKDLKPIRLTPNSPSPHR